MSALLFLQAMPVWATVGTEIALKSGKVQEGEKVHVTSEITGGQEVTNGKIRIYYDASKLILTADSAGDALSGALCEINDSLTGNKEAGELVAAFASTTPLKEDGNLLNMTFQLAEGVKAGDTADIQVNIEELAGDGGSITHNQTHTVSLLVETKEGDLNPDEENKNPDEDQENPNGDHNDPEGDHNNPNGDNNQLGKDNYNSSQSDDKGKHTVNNSGSNTTNSKPPKTGDDTNILLPFLGTGLAVIVAGVVFIMKKEIR